MVFFHITLDCYCILILSIQIAFQMEDIVYNIGVTCEKYLLPLSSLRFSLCGSNKKGKIEEKLYSWYTNLYFCITSRIAVVFLYFYWYECVYVSAIAISMENYIKKTYKISLCTAKFCSFIYGFSIDANQIKTKKAHRRNQIRSQPYLSI